VKRIWTRILDLPGHFLDLRDRIREKEILLIRQILFSGVLGILTGGLVAIFDYLLAEQAISFLYNFRSTGAYFLLPILGLGLAAAATRYLVPSREGELTEDYILVYHAKERRMRLANLPGKMVASFLTIAMGGSMGLEGPSIYVGSALGDAMQNRFDRLFTKEDRKLLLVAGASAGMAAIFKAPLTGLVFAMEAPYKDSMASRALVPAMIASSTSYLLYVFLVGSEPIFAQTGLIHFEFVDLLYAVLLGLCCGIGARLFIWLVECARSLLEKLPAAWTRPVAAGAIVGGLGAITYMEFGEPYIYGPGYHLIRHTLSFQEPLLMLVLLFGAKAVATAFSATGGGVGGLFFPMTVMGVVVGSGFTHLVSGSDGTLYPLIGLAAFVAAGYRTPLAAVSFVAETTGNPWVLIPAMLASVTSFLTMGDKSISRHQRSRTPEF
jgi:chloride channel protein, CIC family